MNMELLKKKGISNPSYGELMAAIKQIEMGENLDEESRMRMADLADIDKFLTTVCEEETVKAYDRSKKKTM